MGLLLALLLKTYPVMAAEITTAGGYSIPLPVRSWQEIRNEGVTRQKFDYSCGATALTSVLSGYYGITTNELEVIDHIGLKQAFSFADLARVADEYGFKATGLALDYATLSHIRQPVIVYLDYWDDGHFSVLTGIDSYGVQLADPAWGNRYLRRNQFERFWSTRDPGKETGRILVLFPKAETTATPNENFFGFNHTTATSFIPPRLNLP